MKCLICKQDTSEKIVKFTSKTLKKCMTVLEYRRCKPVIKKTRTTYHNIELSYELSLNEGYHSQCYKLFTAIKVPPEFQCEGSRSDDSVAMATQTACTSRDETGVSSIVKRELENFDDHNPIEEPVGNEDCLPQKCLICEKTRKRLRGREFPLAINKFQTVETLKNAATEYNDIQMLEKINSFSDASRILYHKCCKDQYLRDISRRDDTEFLKKRKALNNAYIMLCEMLEQRVIKEHECLLFDLVKKEYQILLVEQFKRLSNSLNSSFSDRHLERKLMDTFDKQIKIIYVEKKKFIAPFAPSILSYRDLFEIEATKKSIRAFAVQLRGDNLNSTRIKLPK